MHLARVIGRVVATRRYPGLEGERFLLVRPVDEHGDDAGPTLVACDVAQSGPGDLVHVCDGREATLALHETFVPVDATIVGHVEQFAHEAPLPNGRGRKGEAPAGKAAGSAGGSAGGGHRKRRR